MFYSTEKNQALSQHAVLGLMYALLKSRSALWFTTPFSSSQEEPEVQVEEQSTQAAMPPSALLSVATPLLAQASQNLPSFSAPTLGMPSAGTSALGFFEAAEAPLRQSGLSNAQWVMICLAVAAASIALTSLYHSYKKKSEQSGHGCTATATATATSHAGEGPVTATATATCHC